LSAEEVRVMPELQVSFILPYYLRVGASEYETGQAGEALQVIAPELLEGIAPQTRVFARFTHDDSADQNVIQRQKARDADNLLFRTNRLLRWYRAVTHRADMVELTRAQASPFTFVVMAGPADAAWGTPLQYEGAGQAPPAMTGEQITNRIRDALVTGNEPDVAELFLLDAERALNQGRFREAVLFCWSTIDSVFNRKFEALVKVVLAAEWADSRDFFTGVDFGIKNKMTAGLYLLAQRSVYREPANLWQSLVVSYTKCNRIIHHGQNANEDEARLAISVAQRIVAMMNGIAVPTAAAGDAGGR
jgi:hypothetical protein